MVLRPLILLLLLILTSGCVTPSRSAKGPSEQKVRTFASIYRASKKADAKGMGVVAPVNVRPSPEGYVEPYIPVVQPPRVIKVWIPSHVCGTDRRAMVSGHWAFVMLEETRWWIEEE